MLAQVGGELRTVTAGENRLLVGGRGVEDVTVAGIAKGVLAAVMVDHERGRDLRLGGDGPDGGFVEPVAGEHGHRGVADPGHGRQVVY